MSGHVDTIRIERESRHWTIEQRKQAWGDDWVKITSNMERNADDAADALVAENQRLRDAREWYDEQLRGLLADFEWLLEEHPEHKGAHSDGRIHEIRAALAGTPSEDPPIEALPDPSHDDVRGRAPSFNLFRKPSEDT
jgi:hypothetical protein